MRFKLPSTFDDVESKESFQSICKLTLSPEATTKLSIFVVADEPLIKLIVEPFWAFTLLAAANSSIWPLPRANVAFSRILTSPVAVFWTFDVTASEILTVPFPEIAFAIVPPWIL